jgi:hypothetical protein
MFILGKRNFWVCCVLLFLSVSTWSSAADYRVFKNDDGVELEAEVVSCTEGKLVTVRRRDGRVFKDVAWSRFSAVDRKYLSEWAKAEAKKFSQADLDADARIKVTVLKGQDDDFNDYGDIDDHVVQFEPRVIIDSDEKDRTFTGVTGVLVIVGQGYLRKSEYVVLKRQEFELDIPAREEVRWTGKPFKCSYDPDYGGYRYGGYVLVLEHRAGEIVFTKSSKTLWERSAKAIVNAKERLGYDREFRNGDPLRTTYGLPSSVR